MPQLAHTVVDIERCFPVMAELRPHLVESQFAAMVKGMMEGGYQLVYLKSAEGVVVSVAGFRVSTNLFMGKNLYVDDLVTASTARSQGYGEILLQWLREYAITAGCNVLHLDSGTHRSHAHKFYFKQGMSIASYHFSENLAD